MSARRDVSVAARRARRRANEAGAIMFIVAMTVTVLAGVGLYALRAASVEVKTSGFERQNAQTHYLAEYGVLGAAQEVNNTKAQLYVGLMMSQPDGACVSLPGVPLTASPISKACRRMGSSELSAGNAISGGWAVSPFIPYGGPGVPGSLGNIPLSGDFFVELTDPSQVQPPAGYDLKLGFCFVQMTLSSTGISQPVMAAGLDAAMFGAEGLETARARITGGPIKCAQ